ncbi:hypothetical protein [Parasitella parasitica]|uniref:Uncharacterized protein n=1 Tax=Parasitella parasitica TaxID=35722 RepID=A0A0B7N4V2_9FUNG|nr:hypothetical protein [Parasitella parasitica]
MTHPAVAACLALGMVVALGFTFFKLQSRPTSYAQYHHNRKWIHRRQSNKKPHSSDDESDQKDNKNEDRYELCKNTTALRQRKLTASNDMDGNDQNQPEELDCYELHKPNCDQSQLEEILVVPPAHVDLFENGFGFSDDENSSGESTVLRDDGDSSSVCSSSVGTNTGISSSAASVAGSLDLQLPCASESFGSSSGGESIVLSTEGEDSLSNNTISFDGYSSVATAESLDPDTSNDPQSLFLVSSLASSYSNKSWVDIERGTFSDEELL